MSPSLHAVAPATVAIVATRAEAVARFRGRRLGRPGLWLASGHGVLLLVILVVVALVVVVVLIRSRRS